MQSERAYSLIEVAVAAAILAVLLAAGGLWLLGSHPGALAQATAEFDDAVTRARAEAAANPNGATIAVLPRALGGSGFELRVYTGRPSAAGAVTPTTSMPVVSAASVSEATLGKPPFALFFAPSGHVSGQAHYPGAGSNGDPAFAAIPTEPPCPSAGLILTFTGPQSATATRTLPCTALARAPRVPNPSPTPNVPIVTPAELVYHWPEDARQSFVATEWGYTHWFAAANGFDCGGGIATFPDVLPSPYTPPYTKTEGDASPAPPPGAPYSYPNSGGASMNDAPARFPLDPANAGLCTATVADGFGQQAQTAVQVMGWLTAAYGGKSFTHGTKPSLAIAPGAFSQKGAAVSLPLSKTFDAEPLLPMVAFDNACAPLLGWLATAGSTPSKPSSAPSTATVTLQLTTMPGSNVTCGGTLYDAYPGSQSGEGIPFNLTIDAVQPLSVWPPAEVVASTGTDLGQHCMARAFRNTDFTSPIQGATLADASGSTLVQTDSTGCILDATGTPITGAVAAKEPGYSGNFQYLPGSCGPFLSNPIDWNPSAAGPGLDSMAFSASANRESECSVAIMGDKTVSPTPAPIAVRIQTCADSNNTWSGPTDGHCYDLYYVGMGQTSQGGWTEENVNALYVQHGTAGKDIYEWVVDPQNNPVCYIRPIATTYFASWSILLNNSNPTPPPLASPQPLSNAPGFDTSYAAYTNDVTSAPTPKPTAPAGFTCKQFSTPTPAP